MEAAAGLGALGFWLFIAAVVVAGIWYDARKRESQQETLRRVVESGQKLDPELLDRLLATSAQDQRPGQDYRVAGTIVLYIAPGVAVLGVFLSFIADRVLLALLGVSLLLVFVGLGLHAAGRMIARSHGQDAG